jgi:hypothetical protein
VAFIRHLVVSDEPKSGARVEYRYLVSPIRDFASAPPIELVVVHPDDWQIELTGATSIRETESSDRVTLRGTIDPASVSHLDIAFEMPESSFVTGGPLAAIGVTLDEGDARLRVGYEIGAPPFLVHSLALESDLDERIGAVLMTEAATPNLLFMIPSLAVGLGLPVQARRGDGVRVGARLSIGVSFPFVTVVVPFDLYPGANDAFQVALLAQVSL